MTNPRNVVYRNAKQEYLTPEAFAEHFAVSRMTAYRLLRAGAVKWVRIGRSMRIPVSELERYAKDAEGASYTEIWGQS